MKNKRGDTIAQMILVIGAFAICSFALISFNLTDVKIRNSFVGLEVLEQLNSQIEENAFYKNPLNIELIETNFPNQNIIKAIDYAKTNSVVNRLCKCGDKCKDYAAFIEKASSDNGLPDSILLLSLMMQESGCISNAFSGSSLGLMQINLIHCGSYGLPSEKEECKKELTNNQEKNVEIGAKILKQFYNSYGEGKEFNGCIKVKDYFGWEAALRGYNGWRCNPNLPEQDNFVEEVMKRYEILTGHYLERETTEGILWWTKKTISFSAKYSED